MERPKHSFTQSWSLAPAWLAKSLEETGHTTFVRSDGHHHCRLTCSKCQKKRPVDCGIQVEAKA